MKFSDKEKLKNCIKTLLQASEREIQEISDDLAKREARKIRSWADD